MKHALLSPSSAHRWLVCPGSVEANRKKPRTHNEHSMLGTTAHSLLEVCQRLGDDPANYVGDVIDNETGLAVTEEMAEAVNYALEYVEDLMRTKGAVLHIEKPVYPGLYLGLKKDLLWGTPDIQVELPTELVTVDYKHGVGVAVDVKDNDQIKLYHLGGYQRSPGRYRRYRSVVIQPRLPRRHPVQEHSLTEKQLLTWANDTVKPVIPIALSDSAPRVAGEHCRFCYASGNCEAQMGQKLEKAAREFTEEPKDLGPKRIAELLDLADSVEIAINDLRAHATALVHASKRIPGWEKDWTKPRKVWSDEETVVKLAKKMGLTPRDIYTVALLSPSALDKLLIERGLREKPKKGKPAPPNPFADFYATPDGQPKIAKIKP